MLESNGKNVIFGVSNLHSQDYDLLSIISDENQSLDILRLSKIFVNANMDDFSESDACVTYYVTGYIGRSISRHSKCASCKKPANQG